MTAGDPWSQSLPKARNPLECLLDAHARDGSADDELLDLLGPFEDVVGLIRAYPLVTAGAFPVEFSTKTATGGARWLPLGIPTLERK